MKPTEESRDAHGDFVDESTSVMGGDLLSSLTERSRWNDAAAAPVPEPEISIVVDEPEAVTTMRPVGPPKLLVVDREYPALGDEEATAMMDEPEPTTVAIRKHHDGTAPAPSTASPPPVPPAPAQPTPAPSLPDPIWAAELAPRALPTIRVPPLPAPGVEGTAESTSTRAGSRRLSVLAAVALGVAVWTVGLGHHEAEPPVVIAAPAPSASSGAGCRDATAPGSPQRARCGSSAR
jgi:hypothetical protein